MIGRRRLLAAVSGVVGGSLAGCVGRGPGPRTAEDPWLRRTELNDGRGLEGAVKLRRGEYAAYPFGVADDAGRMNVELAARSRLSLPFDILTYGEEDFARYESGDAAEEDALRSFSGFGVEQFHFQNVLAPGRYVLVFDNTRVGDARPLDDVTISFTFRYSV